MPIRITLRQGAAESPFRRMLTALVTAPFGDSLLLCSGYIQEGGFSNFRILDDLLPAIKAGCASGKVTTVAGKLEYGIWKEQYEQFVRRLVREGVNVEAFYAPRRNWHAKIALRLDNDSPVAGIVGSSNLTRPAFDEPYNRWNFEGDVLIWPPFPEPTAYFRSPDLIGEARIGVIDALLDPDVPQPSEKDQLFAIYRDIIGSQLEPLDIRH